MIGWIRTMLSSGRDCFRTNRSEFWASLRRLPKFLFLLASGQRAQLAEDMTARILKIIREMPLDEEGQKLFGLRPKQMALTVAYMSSLPVWYAPRLHFQLVEEVAPQALRHWRWALGQADG